MHTSRIIRSPIFIDNQTEIVCDSGTVAFQIRIGQTEANAGTAGVKEDIDVVDADDKDTAGGKMARGNGVAELREMSTLDVVGVIRTACAFNYNEIII